MSDVAIVVKLHDFISLLDSTRFTSILQRYRKRERERERERERGRGSEQKPIIGSCARANYGFLPRGTLAHEICMIVQGDPSKQ